MQTIGMMNDGQVLRVLSEEEVNVLLAVGKMIDAARTTIPPAAVPLCSRGGNAVAAPVKPVKSCFRIRPERKSASKRRKKCDVCGKVFFDNTKTNSRKTCDKATCIKEKKRRYQVAWIRNAIKEERAASTGPNPSDPFLTDEQRKEMMARREKLIAASAQKHADD